MVADAGRQFVKIGMSRDADSRIQALQPHCPLVLELIATYPCTYARYREFVAHWELTDLHLHNEWFRWDEIRVRDAIAKALAVPEELIKVAVPKRASLDYPVRRTDTGEAFENAKHAAMAVLGDKSLAAKIRKAVRDGVKCGPSFWTRV